MSIKAVLELRLHTLAVPCTCASRTFFFSYPSACLVLWLCQQLLTLLLLWFFQYIHLVKIELSTMSHITAVYSISSLNLQQLIIIVFTSISHYRRRRLFLPCKYTHHTFGTLTSVVSEKKERERCTVDR